MNKKKIIIIILVLLILFGIYTLYNTFAVSTIASNNNENVYDIDINEDTTINVPKGSSKTIYYHIKNTNSAAVKYGVGYNTSTNIEIKVYEDSKDKVLDIINYGDNKYIKLYLNNPTNNDNTVTISCVLGYENGGDLIILDDISLITEVYTPPKVTTLSDYITNLYTTTEKSTVVNNEITYNYASSVSLMNDRLGGKTASLDGGNIRYYGSSPNNYIYFNCSNYNNQTSDTCELWRIVGVFDDKVKIIRNEPIGEYSWDIPDLSSSEFWGINEWSQAKLMKLLNPGYESESVGGSLYYNSSSGTCYANMYNSSKTKSCDFTSSGIKNEVTKSKIASVTWNLGGWDDSDIYSNQIYGYERGGMVVLNPNDGITRNTIWTGKVAIPYSSDYGYATDFNKCTQKLISYGNASDSYACRSNDWIYPIITNSSSRSGWLLTPTTDGGSGALNVSYEGDVNYNILDYNNTDSAQGIVPTLYLSTDETIADGTTGSQDNPFKLTLHSSEGNNETTITKHITNLYTNAEKSTVENNSITYNYASSESLMNDRLGETTTSLDGGNIRYYGASPNNYIYFNCETYPDTNCELWRIIGIFDNKLKIMRNSSIGTFSWDSSASTTNSGYGINEWSQADAMKLLNPGYDTESVGGSLYYNSSSGTCYSNSKNTTKSCDFTSSGIKNEATRNKIASAIYNTVGWNTAGIFSDTIYGYERGTTVISNPSDGITRNTTWNGKIAIPYPSDYGYAADFTSCNAKLNSYSSTSCSSWMKDIMGASTYGWLLTANSSIAYGALSVRSSGNIDSSGSYYYTSYPRDIFPTLFLNSDETIVEGTTGTEDNPYKLNP